MAQTKGQGDFQTGRNAEGRGSTDNEARGWEEKAQCSADGRLEEGKGAAECQITTAHLDAMSL